MKVFHIDFYGHRKIFFTISLSLIAIGIIFNFIFGTQLDIQFKGGAQLKYSYSGTVDAQNVTDAVKSSTKRSDVSVTVNKNVKSADGSSAANNVTIAFTGTQNITVAQQKTIAADLNKVYPAAGFKFVSSDSIDPSMGQAFFAKCICAILLAFLFLILYVAVRFKNIGGMPAATMAIAALLHDVLMVYFVFIIFRIPLDNNFIAVVLTILGYSLNDTIVIYDRIRENRKLMGVKASYSELLNLSLNQCFSRTVYTSVTTFIAITVVFIVGQMYHLTSITSFSLPMMVGVVSGCYSTECIAGPLYVMWENHKMKKLALADGGVQAAEKLHAAPAVKAVARPADDAGKNRQGKKQTRAQRKKK